MLKTKALRLLQASLFLAAIALTAVAFQPTPVAANSAEWCQLNCGGGRNFCGAYIDETGKLVRCKQDLSNCI